LADSFVNWRVSFTPAPWALAVPMPELAVAPEPAAVSGPAFATVFCWSVPVSAFGELPMSVFESEQPAASKAPAHSESSVFMHLECPNYCRTAFQQALFLAAGKP
jgi:hypothetical protein